MITSRVTRLLRASDLRTFQSAIVGVVPRGWDARLTAIVVPSRSAAEELRRTIEDFTLAADGAGSRVDVRSKSRVGKGDLGTKAQRIRAYQAGHGALVE